MKIPLYAEHEWENINSDYEAYFDTDSGSIVVETFMLANIPASALDIDTNDREKATAILVHIVKQHYPEVADTIRALIGGQTA